MYSARTFSRAALPRTARAVRVPRTTPQPRFQSTAVNSTSPSNGTNSHFAAGVAGGVAGGALLYGIYLVTPAGKMTRKMNKTAREAQKKYDEAAKKMQQNTPTTDQALDSIKQFAYSYVGWIPGGRAYVDTAFKDIDTVRQNHGDEVDKIVSDAYGRLRDVSKSGLSMETLSRAYEVLADLSKQLASLSGDAIGDILNNHPQLHDKVGGGIQQLKQLGNQLGPEAKKQVDDTWRQVSEIMGQGFSIESANKVRQLINDKTEQVKKLGDEAFKKGMEQAKPYLDKNPKAKELIEKNADALKQGNATELFQQVRSAVESGNMGDLEKYVNQATEKAKSAGSGAFGGSWDQLMGMLPQGGEIMPLVNKYKDVFEAHSREGEQLLKETAADLKKVLEDKAQKAEEIVEKARRDSKK